MKQYDRGVEIHNKIVYEYIFRYIFNLTWTLHIMARLVWNQTNRFNSIVKSALTKKRIQNGRQKHIHTRDRTTSYLFLSEKLLGTRQ